MRKKFGECLKESRKKTGMKQSELAEKVGVSFTYISKLERGKEDPPSEEICIRLAKALGEDPFLITVRAGRVPTEFQQILMNDKAAFNYLIQKVKAMEAKGR
ncbi:helix-turn-helix transcriptional regulator [Paenibacillus chitinolyticus]|uniref:helix-turn-helix transcriptional regulator n=1 Tax=Paenibacillus chitinolyticus TaxID=79263 RepID=UPI001C470D7E|nr:helix-turn-helix transcriptional regulator [Paenibacillus chitinolyticus]MBV6717223.1 helix-turn-helix domain-containing protein [Paenibacillus chitinolyticus]